MQQSKRVVLGSTSSKDKLPSQLRRLDSDVLAEVAMAQKAGIQSSSVAETPSAARSARQPQLESVDLQITLKSSLNSSSKSNSPASFKPSPKLQSEQTNSLQNTMTILIDNTFEVIPRIHGELLKDEGSDSSIDDNSPKDENVAAEDAEMTTDSKGEAVSIEDATQPHNEPNISSDAIITDTSPDLVGSSRTDHQEDENTAATTATDNDGGQREDIIDNAPHSNNNVDLLEEVAAADEDDQAAADLLAKKKLFISKLPKEEDLYKIDLPLKKKLNKSMQRKLWHEIERRKPFITQNVATHIQNFAKPPFVTWGTKYHDFPYDINSFTREYWHH